MKKKSTHSKQIGKRILIGVFATWVVWIFQWRIFDLIIDANYTNYDVPIGDAVPWILKFIIWYLVYLSVRNYIRRISRD